MKEEFPQETKVVNETILLGQQSITMSSLLELSAAFGKWYVSLEGLPALMNIQFFRSVLLFFGPCQVRELSIQLL